jgi:hypothetical protein
MTHSTAAALGIALAAMPLLAGEPAPVPAQILTSKKVFLSNAGVDATSFGILSQAGDIIDPFNRIYAALKSAGRFDLVGAPSDAELVFEVRFATRYDNCKAEPDLRFWPQPPSYYESQLVVTVLDARTHFILWTLEEPLGVPRTKGNWSKSLDQAVAHLVGGLKNLAGS